MTRMIERRRVRRVPGRTMLGVLGASLAMTSLGFASAADAAATRADSGAALNAAAAVAANAAAASAAAAKTETGSASFYHNSLAGRKTASGVPYNPRAMVAAHRTLPFGTLVKVTNLSNGRSVQVKIVDRGPFAKGRIIDLSRVAAERLDFIKVGHTRVKVEVVGRA